MHNRFYPLLSISLAIALVALSGCGGSDTPTIPSIQDDLTRANSSTRIPLGLWQFHIDPETESIDFIPLRVCDGHMNVLAFMEPPAGVALYIDQLVDFCPEELTVDIGLSHPYPGMNFATAFDVSGILISHGSIYYPFSDTLYYPGDNQVRLLNPDGYIRWWNPVEFPENPAKPHTGYIDGLLGTPHSVADFDSTLNGYKYFASDLTDPESPLSELDTSMRGAFVPGTTCIRRYQIGFSTGNLVFNYAVDASWAPAEPSGPVIEIPDDFPPSANRPEPYRIELQNVSNTLAFDSGSGMVTGELAMSVYVYDWFNPESTMVCTFAQNDELMGLCNPDPVEVGDGYAVFDTLLTPMGLNSTDDILIWFTVDCEESGYQGALPFELQGVYFNEWIQVAE